jgi:hypothetical protein
MDQYAKCFFCLIYDFNEIFLLLLFCFHLGNERAGCHSQPFSFSACVRSRSDFEVVFFLFSQGHGGSDGAHGYVSSLDHAVGDLVLFLEARSYRLQLIVSFISGLP